MIAVFSRTAVLRGYAQEVGSRDGRGLRDTPSSFSGHMGAGMSCSLSTRWSLVLLQDWVRDTTLFILGPSCSSSLWSTWTNSCTMLTRDPVSLCHLFPRWAWPGSECICMLTYPIHTERENLLQEEYGDLSRVVGSRSWLHCFHSNTCWYASCCHSSRVCCSTGSREDLSS